MSTLVRSAVLLLAGAVCVAAQDSTRSDLISVRMVSAQGEGQLEEDQEPSVAPELKDWTPLLKRLGLETFLFLERVSQRAPAGTLLRFELPGKLLTEVSGTPEVGSKPETRRILLKVTITKPPQAAGEDGEAPATERVLILTTEVRVADGQEIVFRCAEGVPKGELIVIVGASEDPLE
ncbi:MAG: hypothetical protein KDD82_17565 [Planctomycetes bacterium]|nr:hypothetical protein [Planctomycetota bacterium]